MRSLLLIGAGGFAREVVEVVRAINEKAPTWELLGFLDDRTDLQGCVIDGTAVLGPCEAITRFSDAKVVVCTGNPGNYFSRKRLVTRLGLASERYATLVHPSAIIPPAVELGPGTVLLAGVVATTRALVGAHAAVMPAVVLTHDNVVADYATLGAGVRLAGGVRIEEGAYLGAGVMVRENLTVGPWALVGMGSVVVDSIPGCEVWAGVPARHLRRVATPGDLATL